MASQPVQLAFRCVEPDDCDKSKAPIIFLHGLTSSKEQWHDIPDTIAKATKRKAYAVDTRNHGESPWCDMPDYNCGVDDLMSFMDRVGAPKFILVGHSMGGIAAMKTALKAPERVEKLVVEDMTCCRIPQTMIDTLFLAASLGQAALALVPPEVDEKTARRMIVDGAVKSLPLQLKQLVKPEHTNFRVQLRRNAEGRWDFEYNINTVLKALKNSSDLITGEKGVYEGPTCFIYGTLSPFQVSKDEENIKKYFPNAQLVGIENAAHSVHSDCPGDFTNALLTFLQA